MSNNNTKIDGRIRVCTRISLSAECPEDIDENKIGWKVKIDKEEFRLKDLKAKKILLGENVKVSGKNISFVVPKEWGQKTATITAYLREDETQLVNETYQVLDHIVAAFYRIDSNKTHKYILKGMNYNSDNYINILPVPVHHHQGIFKYRGKYYIAGSTQRSVPCYTYEIEEKNTIYPKNEKDNKDVKYTDPFLFDKGIINEYRHGGGLQIANGLLAIGIEKYDYSMKKGFGSASIDESVVLFYDLKEKKEYKYLRITYGSFYDDTLKNDLKEEDENKRKYKEDYFHDKETHTYEYIRGLKENNNFASAVGIVYDTEKDVYYVAVRGSEKSVWLYLIEEDKSKITYLKTFKQVGEFQNMNLFVDDIGDIYLFGMGRGQMPESTDTCMIYKIFIKEDELSNDKKYTLQNVFIDPNDGIIKEIPHNEKEYAKYPNRMTFKCKDGTSFNWSSCVHLGTRENNIHKIPHDQTSQTMENGFQGVFTIYTTESTIPNFDDAIYGISDQGDMKCYYFTETR